VSFDESESSLNSGDHCSSTSSISGHRIERTDVSRTKTGASRPSLLIDGCSRPDVRGQTAGRVEPTAIQSISTELRKRSLTSCHSETPIDNSGYTAAVGSSLQCVSWSSSDDGSARLETPTSGYGSAADVGSDDSTGVVLPPLLRSPVTGGVATTNDAGGGGSRVKALSSQLNLTFGSGASSRPLGERRTGAGSSSSSVSTSISSDGIGASNPGALKSDFGDSSEHYERLPALKSPPSSATKAPSPPPLRPTTRMVNGEQSKPSGTATQTLPAAGPSDGSAIVMRKMLPMTSGPAGEDFLSKAETMRREFVRQSRLSSAEKADVGILTKTDQTPALSSPSPATTTAAAAAPPAASSSASSSSAAAAAAAKPVVATAANNSALARQQLTSCREVESSGNSPVAESAFSAAIRIGANCLRKPTTSGDARTPTEDLPVSHLARMGSESRLSETAGNRTERQFNPEAASTTGNLPTSGCLVSNSKSKPPAPPKPVVESTKAPVAPPVNKSVGVRETAVSLASNQREPPRKPKSADKPPPPMRRASSNAILSNDPPQQPVPTKEGPTLPLPPPSVFAESEMSSSSSTMSADSKQVPRPKVAPKLTNRSMSVSSDKFSIDAGQDVAEDATAFTSNHQSRFFQRAPSLDHQLLLQASSPAADVTFVTGDDDSCLPSNQPAVELTTVPPPPIFDDSPPKSSMTSAEPTARPVANNKPIPPVPRKPLSLNYAPSNNCPTSVSGFHRVVGATSAPANSGNNNNKCDFVPLSIPPPTAYNDDCHKDSATFDCQPLPPPPAFPTKIATNVATGSRIDGGQRAATGGKPVCDWTVDDVGNWLEKIQLGKHRERFQLGGVDGRRLIDLDRGKFIELGVAEVGDRMSIERQLLRLSKK
jgi:hypothetical protein